jgi:uncharacterized Zn finger protein (UPF0148 family)
MTRQRVSPSAVRARCERCGVPKTKRIHQDGTTYCIRCDDRPASPLSEYLDRVNALTATPLKLRRTS